jgi:hypothetical protein
MKKIKSLILCLFLALTQFTYAYDWENCSLSAGVEVVTNYNWRGQNIGGLSTQPWVEFSAYGFNIGAWGSVGSGPHDDFNQFIPELDLSFSYTSPDEHFTLGLTHYYYFDGPFFGGNYKDNLGTSQSEISVSIFGHEEYPLEIGFNMMFGGGDYYSANGVLIMENQTTAKKLFSTYLYLKYTFEVDNVEIIPEIGLSPNASMYTYYDKKTDKHLNFAMNNISCTINYEFWSSDLVSAYLTGNFFFNLYDVGYEQFEYGKNFCASIGLGIEL